MALAVSFLRSNTLLPHSEITDSFILRAVSGFLKKPPSSTNLIVLHLGSGSSTCAIQHGKSLDTSMGFTPLSGLPGATRSGSVDPSLIFHYTSNAVKATRDHDGIGFNLHITEVLSFIFTLKLDCIPSTTG